MALALAARAPAEVPAQLRFQGRVLDGGAVPTSPTTLTVRLYDQPSGGVALFEETDQVDLDASGVFATTLGDQATLDPALVSGELYAGVAVGGEPEAAARLPLHAVPYALLAARAEALEANVRYVSHEGDDVAAGAALLAAATEVGALASSASPWVLRVGPGRFDLDGSQLGLEAYVSLVGAGHRATTLVSAVGSGTVRLLGNQALRQVAVEGSPHGVAVDGAFVTLRRVRVRASSDTAQVVGIDLTRSLGVLIEDSWVDASTAADQPVRGMRWSSSDVARAVVRRIDLVVSCAGSTSLAYGIRWDSDTAEDLVLESVVFDVDNPGSGGSRGVGAIMASGVQVLGSDLTGRSSGGPNSATHGAGTGYARSTASRLRGGRAGNACGYRDVQVNYNALGNVACP